MKWKIDNNYGEYLYIVEDQGKRWDNPVVCQLYEDVTPEDSVTIGSWYESFPGAESNARLIAAAPDLYKRLEEFANRMGRVMQDYELPEDVKGIICGELDMTNDVLDNLDYGENK